jgi:hypothetical protein
VLILYMQELAWLLLLLVVLVVVSLCTAAASAVEFLSQKEGPRWSLR